MLDFANSQALKSKQAKATAASNIIKNVILADLNELYSPAEIEILQQAQQLIEDGKGRIQHLKEKRRGEEKLREAAEAKVHDKAFQIALSALDGMSLAELYQLNVCFSFQHSAINELIADYDHQHYLATVQSWLDADVATDVYVDQSPEEAREEWMSGIAEAAVEIISWPCLKYHRDYQESPGQYIAPVGIPDDFPQAIYSETRENNLHRLTAPCLEVIRAIKVYEENEEKVRLILSKLGQ
ncbi:hypothetical protein MD588_06370 [Photobacterium sp. SDRW27]|uniref:hypothetical protein n=1 Tax=Photobacterium obscurum TaxID=2829490 RepID=UPI002242EB4D|nr:hypothetical protein [Photobacterium obscurum]MCW8328430.1 hypothetical protein [Photobacterium obscurum]